MNNSNTTFNLLSDFLTAFFPDPDEEIRIRALPPKGCEASPRSLVLTRNQLMSVVAVQDQLTQLNMERGLYFVVNSGGDNDAEISGYGAFFCENDDVSISEQHARLNSSPMAPSIRVETLKSVHAYWLI